jgi:probable rRNA maturation factor
MEDDPGPEKRVNLEVSILNLQHIVLDTSRLEDVARRTALSEGARGELSVVLVDPVQMAEMNSHYRDECGPTDVLSFSIDGLIAGGVGPGDDPPLIIGEVIICPEVAAMQATEGLDSEMDLLVAHGVLHLLGFDHDSEESAALMRGREQKHTGRSGAKFK